MKSCSSRSIDAITLFLVEENNLTPRYPSWNAAGASPRTAEDDTYASLPLVLHVIDSLSLGGAETLLASNIEVLSGSYRQELVTLGPSDGPLRPRIEPFVDRIFTLNCHSNRELLLAMWRLYRLFGSRQPALIHTHLQRAALCAKVACPASVPLLYSLHSEYSRDAFASSKGRVALGLERLTTRPSHHLLAVSQVVLNDYQQYVTGFGTASVLYNPVRDEFFDARKTPSVKDPSQPLRMVAVGWLNEAKNYSYALDAMSALINHPVSLDIWGEGPLRSNLEAIIRNRGLVNVRLRGARSGLHTILPDYDVYLTTSSHEGFGIAPVEGMAVGLPVIASDIPVYREVLGSAALLCDLTSSGDLVTQIERFLSDSDGSFQAERSALACARSAEISSSRRYRKGLLEVYDRLIGTGQRSIGTEPRQFPGSCSG